MNFTIPEWIATELGIKENEKIYFALNQAPEAIITRTTNFNKIIYISKVTRMYSKNRKYYHHYTNKPKNIELCNFNLVKTDEITAPLVILIPLKGCERYE